MIFPSLKNKYTDLGELLYSTVTELFGTELIGIKPDTVVLTLEFLIVKLAYTKDETVPFFVSV